MMVEVSNLMCLILNVKEEGCLLFLLSAADWSSLLFLFDR